MVHFGSIASRTVPTLHSPNGQNGQRACSLSIAHGDNHLHRGASKDALDLLSSLETLSCTR
jgi:hypothetical protein